MDDWEDPDERLKAEVIRGLGPDARDAHVEVTRTSGGSRISISGLGPLRGPTCKTCGSSLISTPKMRRRWWQRRIEHICPKCDPDHPLSIFVRNSEQDFQ